MKQNLLTRSSLLVLLPTIFSFDAKLSGSTYYGITDGAGGFYWTKIAPERQFYTSMPGLGYATIHAINDFIPVNNQVPDLKQAIPSSTRHCLYKRLPGT
ncbi:hypothetical protein PV783_13625 [Chitinophaga sp. CC14]|uniref:hypothetical protein n=1 Tax=Chitinophaga sp. CC14 TaxID=3029199 RepID=UPI003B813EF9